MADLTQIVISAQDKTQAAFSSIDRNFAGLKATAAAASAGIAALGGALGAGAIVAWAEGVISAASALDDLADATGSSVENLSKLSNIARVSGASFDTIDAAIKKLAVGMAGVDDESTKAGKALAALGISARDPAQALQDIAIKFDQFRDGPEKAALAVQIFGKAGASLLPILKDLAANQDIASTVTTKQAADAEKLEQALRRLGVQSSVFKTLLLSEVVPALTATVSSFNAARAAGLGFFDALSMTGNYGNAGIVKAVDDARKNVDTLRASFNRYTAEGAQGLANQLLPQLNVAEARLRAYITIRDQMARSTMLTGPDTFDSKDFRAGNMKGVAPTIPSGPDPKVAKAAVSDYTDEIMRLRQEMLKLTNGGEAPYPKLAAAVTKYVADLKAGKIVSGEQAMEMFKVAQAADELAVAAKTAADAWDEYAKAAEKSRDEKEQMQLQAVRVAEGILAENKALQLEHNTLGMDDNLRQQYITNMQIAEEAAKGNVIVVEQLTDRLKLLQQQASDKAAIAYQTSWTNAAREISDSLTDAFVRAAESGRGFFKTLANDLKRMFSNLVLRPIIQGVMAPIGGAIASSLYGGSAYGQTGAGGVGSIGNYASTGQSLYSMGGTSSSLYGSAVGFSTSSYGTALGLSSTYADVAAGGVFAESAVMTGAGEALAGIAAAAPYIAAVIAIAYALYQAFGQQPGAPKTGGYAFSGSGMDPWNRTDQFTNGGFQPGHFTPNQMDEALQPIANDWVKGLSATVKAFGGKLSAAAFDIGIDKDPGGTSSNRLGIRASVNRQQVYNYWSGDSLGRDDQTLQDRIQLESKRAVLAALQASELPQQIADVFDRLTAATATSAQIDNLMAFGAAMKSIMDSISGSVVGDATTLWVNSQKTSAERLADMAANVINLAAATDGTTESMQALASATGEYRNAVVQVLVAIKQVAAQAKQMQGQLVESIQTSGFDAWQSYNYQVQKANEQAALLGSTTSPEDVGAISTAVYNAINAAFNSLPEDMRDAYKPALLGFLSSFGDAVEANLKRIGDQTAAGTESPFAAANQALSDAAGKFDTAAVGATAAANTQLQAANIQLQAANVSLQAATTPIIVRIAGSEVNG